MLKALTGIAFGGLIFTAAAARADDAWYAALAADNADSSPVVWGKSKKEAKARALRACQALSTTCGDEPASTSTRTDVFVTVCCQKPELGCLVSPDSLEEVAEDGARRALEDAGYSVCKAGRYLSAKTGEPTGYVDQSNDNED